MFSQRLTGQLSGVPVWPVRLRASLSLHSLMHYSHSHIYNMYFISICVNLYLSFNNLKEEEKIIVYVLLIREPNGLKTFNIIDRENYIKFSTFKSMNRYILCRFGAVIKRCCPHSWNIAVLAIKWCLPNQLYFKLFFEKFSLTRKKTDSGSNLKPSKNTNRFTYKKL